jgi:hypothetical protein
VKAELVFNLDEAAVSKWEDRRDKKVAIPRTISGQTMHHRVSSNVKPMPITMCISAPGKSLTPYTVISQNSQSLRRKLITSGVRLGVDFVSRQRSKPYVDAAFFLEYVNGIFIADLNELRDSEQFDACAAVLMMDNYLPHMSVDVIAVLTNARVTVIIFAPHTTHVFQILDVVLFCALKKHTTGLEILNEESGTVTFTLKLYHDVKQTVVEINRCGTFSAIGCTHDIIQDPYILRFDDKSSDRVPASWSSGSATHLWRVCRHDVNRPSLGGLTNQNKLICSKIPAILPASNKDMRPTI